MADLMHLDLSVLLDAFLDIYPEMSIAPFCRDGLCLQGDFSFKAFVFQRDEIKDKYKLKIVVPKEFPKKLPHVEETNGKIPRYEDFHVNSDGTLCLGSPIRLLTKIQNSKNIMRYINVCLIPYLYAVSLKLMTGEKFIFGELDHGIKGLFRDYFEVFGFNKKEQVSGAIRLLSLKKRIANKNLCPCGCKKRLGICRFHFKLNRFRKLASRSWFKEHWKNFLKY